MAPPVKLAIVSKINEEPSLLGKSAGPSSSYLHSSRKTAVSRIYTSC